MSHLTTLNGRLKSVSARRQGPYWLGLGVVILAYVVGLGWFLAYSRGLPYVLDNNETFSSLVHARNLLSFGVRETFGLTDESYGLQQDQHPYVYTHGGNFPRFYTLLLYVLGARTAESQILVTVFTVGLGGLLLAYHFVSRIATPLFAVMYCLLLMSDYVMQTQWLVNTWRAWHHFFVFSSLLCVHSLARRRRRLPRRLAALTLLNFACLAYLEVVFAATVTLLAAAYMALIRWRRPRQVARAWLLMVGGAALGAAVLCSQVIGYLGWEGFVEDVRLTFLARNTAAADLRAFRTEVWSFVEDHRLVFWDNFLGHIGINSTILRWLLLIYSPALVFLALLISAAWALSFLPALELVIHSRGSRRTWPAQSALPWATGAATLFVCAIFMDRSFAGFADGSRQMGSVGAALAVIVGAALGAVGLALHRRLRESAKDDFELPAIRLLLVAALLFCFAILARHHPDLYNGGERLAPLFRRVISRTGGTVVWQVAALAAATLAVGLLLAPRTLIGRERRGFRRLFLLLAAGVVAVVTVFHLFPGYVVTGYLQRYCPLTVYLHLVPFAAAFYVLARVVQAFGSAVLASRLVPPDSRSKVTPAAASSRHPLMHSTMSACALLLLGLLSFYWVSLQARLIGEFDPRAILFKELQKPQYAGASFVVNTYAAPIAFITKGWAYFDPQIGKSELRNPEPGKFYLRRDFRYLWLADKRLNKAYFEPDYFVCWIPRQLLYRGDTCRELQIVTEARNGTSLLRHREVARDPSGRDEWSIVRLSWTYPPGSGSKIEWHPRQYWRTLALPE